MTLCFSSTRNTSRMQPCVQRPVCSSVQHACVHACGLPLQYACDAPLCTIHGGNGCAPISTPSVHGLTHSSCHAHDLCHAGAGRCRSRGAQARHRRCQPAHRWRHPDPARQQQERERGADCPAQCEAQRAGRSTGLGVLRSRQLRVTLPPTACACTCLGCLD